MTATMEVGSGKTLATVERWLEGARRWAGIYSRNATEFAGDRESTFFIEARASAGAWEDIAYDLERLPAVNLEDAIASMLKDWRTTVRLARIAAAACRAKREPMAGVSQDAMASAYQSAINRVCR